MTKVFLSSVKEGLEPYRKAIRDAIDALDDHQIVCMEDFGARGDQPIETSLSKVRECAVFVCLLGHRYGSSPPNGKRSYCELEYEAARKVGIRIHAFSLNEDAPIPADLIEPDERRLLQKQFRERVLRETTAPLAMHGPIGLGQQVVASLFNEFQQRVVGVLQKTRAELIKSGQIYVETPRSVLLFQFVSNQAGFDTGVAISNISGNPFGQETFEGTFVIHYYGGTTGGGEAPTAQWSSASVRPGQYAAFTLSSGGTNGIAATPGFQGYLVVECRFPAHGIAMITDIGAQRMMSAIPATILPTPTPTKRKT